MTAAINFQTFEIETAFLDPRRGFQTTVVKSQVRVDPLTGRTGHFSHFGALKPQKPDLARYLEPETKGFCPFCGEQVNQITPKFPAAFLPEGRLARGEALLVPNLFPYDVYSAVTIMTREHLVPLEQFSEKILADACGAGIAFLQRTKAVSPEIPYHAMTWNYMPPSGGGLVHPHQQYFATEHPGNQFRDELKAAAAFYARHQADFWTVLAQEEQARGQRYLGRSGQTQWLTSFVSFGLLGEIIFVFPGVYSINDFTAEHVADLVAGLRKVFRYFADNDIFSFNAALFFGPGGQRHFPVHGRIVPRIFLNTRDFAPDFNFFQALLQEPVSVVLPEDLCRSLQPYFAG